MNKRDQGKGFTAEEFKKEGYRIVDWIAEYMKDVERYPVRAQAKPGQIYDQIPTKAPKKGESFENIFKDFERVIIPGITHWQHPSFFAFFPANTSPPSMLAEFLTAGLGVNAMLWETSPAATELEERVMEWLKEMIGLPAIFKGVIQDTASTASLCALVCAREKATGLRVNQTGFLKHHKLRVYISDQAHSSIEKGAKIAGYGKENIVVIGTDKGYRMKPEALREALITDIEQQFVPGCVVATVGTTSSTAIDPVDEIGDICSRFRVWFHVDAAHAGSAAILPEKRDILKGIERANSFVFNPHKWLLTNFDCSAFYVQDSEFLRSVFSINPEYLKTGVDHEVINYRDWGIQLGRRFRALKLWFVLRSYGVEGLQKILRDHISWANEFAGWVDKSNDFELMTPVTVNLVCFRYNPDKGKKEADEAKLAELNKELINTINDSGKLYLTHTSLKGRYCLRLCVGQTNTTLGHVKKAWQEISRWRPDL